MIQLIAVDMDGTLLNNDTLVTEKNAQAIKKIQASGIHFVVNTGRAYPHAKEILDKANITCDFICLSGATIYTSDGKCTSEYLLSDQAVRKILNTLKSHNLIDEIMTDKGSYTTSTKEAVFKNITENVIPAVQSLGKTTEHISDNLDTILSQTTSIPDIDTLLNKGLKIYKITSTTLNKGVLASVRKELEDSSPLAIASSFPVNIEITDIKAQKGTALAQYAQELNIPMEHIMAIGDSENDYSMLSMDFGYTVAMGNADDNIKEICKYETLSNDQDGIWYILEQMKLI